MSRHKVFKRGVSSHGIAAVYKRAQMPGEDQPPKVLNCKNLFFCDPSQMLSGTDFPCCIHQQTGMGAGRIFRMEPQEIHLSLQLLGIAPVIVPVQIRKKLSFCPLLQIQKVVGRSHVFLPKNRDHPRILCGLQDLLRRPVRRSIISHQQFKRKIRILFQHALDRFLHIFLMVVCNHQNADRY